jgi:hypothetical protein
MADDADDRKDFDLWDQLEPEQRMALHKLAKEKGMTVREFIIKDLVREEIIPADKPH